MPPLFTYAAVGKAPPPAGGVVLAEFAFDGPACVGDAARAAVARSGGEAAAARESAADDDEGRDVEHHRLERDGVVFVVAAPARAAAGTDAAAEAGSRRAKADGVLKHLASEFASRIGAARARLATRRFAFNAEFAGVLRRALEGVQVHADASPANPFSIEDGVAEEGGRDSERLRRISAELARTKDAAAGALERAAERGMKLVDVASHSESLAQSSQEFRQSATALRRRMHWELVSGKACIVLVFVLLIILVVWLVKR